MIPAFKPTCRKCEHHSPGWCKRYGSVIHQGEPVTRCERRKTETIPDPPFICGRNDGVN
jgi:hypothetical protein